MAENKRVARGKLFRQAFAQAKVSFQRSMRELERLVEELRSRCKSTTTLGIETLALLDGRFVQVFSSQAGLVLFYSDGNVFWAVSLVAINV